MTRSECYDAIESCGDDLAALLTLYKSWVGHDEVIHPDDYNKPLSWRIDYVRNFIFEYVDECCMAEDGDEIRSRGPRGSDPTGIPE